ncbi:MAG: helix-turn-helix transcriptional regulator [Bacteroidales bacterium]|nr:helix-turn-helix transcriptional regulator [Bacteroidales bacterium]
MNNKNSNIQTQIIQKIKKLRSEKNISQLALSDILGVSDGQIGNIESPKYSHKYTLKQLYDFCIFVEYPFEKLFLSDEELKSKDVLKLLISKIIEYDE